MAKQKKPQQKTEERRSKPIPKAAERVVSRATKDGNVTKTERRDIRQAVRGSGGTKAQAKATVKSAKTTNNNSYSNNAIGQYARTADMYGMGTADQGVFSGASWNQAKAAGYTDQQIRDYLSGGNTGLMIGNRVQEVLNNYDNMASPAPDMPAGYDPRGEGREIAPSTASRPDVFFSPVNMEGINNMWGNPMGNGVMTSSIVGDGKNWQDPANAAELARYRTPEMIMNGLNGAYAMSTANPNLAQNMAAFVDSGHRESLLTGKTPSANPQGWNELYPAAMGTASTPWSQAYANQLSYKSPWMK